MDHRRLLEDDEPGTLANNLKVSQSRKTQNLVLILGQSIEKKQAIHC